MESKNTKTSTKSKKEVQVVDLPAETEVVPVPQEQAAPDYLIAKAIENKLPVETMERLLAMRTQLKAEQAKEAFFRDLAEFQAKCPVIKKTKTVLNKDKKTVRYHYAPLDDIVAQVASLLRKYGFSYTIQAKYETDPQAQVAICTVHHVEGHSESSEFRAPINNDDYMNEVQKNASSLTYAKRYAFCNAFGILTGDEDTDAQTDGPQQRRKEAAKNTTSTQQSQTPPAATKQNSKIKQQAYVEANKFRTEIINEIGQILQADVFTEADKTKAKTKIKENAMHIYRLVEIKQELKDEKMLREKAEAKDLDYYYQHHVNEAPSEEEIKEGLSDQEIAEIMDGKILKGGTEVGR